jgi:arginase family enzyme
MEAEGTGAINVVNIDAHLDARPLNSDGQAHSGSPFFQLLQASR